MSVSFAEFVGGRVPGFRIGPLQGGLFDEAGDSTVAGQTRSEPLDFFWSEIDLDSPTGRLAIGDLNAWLILRQGDINVRWHSRGAHGDRILPPR